MFALQLGRAFIPELQLLQQEQVLEFRNSENELHATIAGEDGTFGFGNVEIIIAGD